MKRHNKYQFTNNERKNRFVVVREVQECTFEGSKMHIKGYIYITDILEYNEDDIIKLLVLKKRAKQEAIFIPLEDTPFPLEGNHYNYAGFKGSIDFATIGEKQDVLKPGDYDAFLQIKIRGKYDIIRTASIPNIEDFLRYGLYMSQITVQKGKQLINYRVIIANNPMEKTLGVTMLALNRVPLDLSNWGAPRQQSHTLRVLLRKSKTLAFKIGFAFAKLLPLQKNKITFASDSRTDLSGNFEFVYNEIKRQKTNGTLPFTPNIKLLLKRFITDEESYWQMFTNGYHLGSSKFVLLDDFYPRIYTMNLRQQQELIQLWHAVGAFKTFGYSRIGRPGGPPPNSLNHRNYTKAIVSSEGVRKYYAEGFGISIDKVIATGIPRTDVFFDNQYMDNKKQDLYEKYPQLVGKTVLMFAPTFRGKGQQSAYYDFKALNLMALYNKFKDTHVFIFKMHPFIKQSVEIPEGMGDFYLDLSHEREINDLLFISDILITDYSSTCFEFGLLNKPMIFFSYDLKDYIWSRDFYFNYLDFVPGPIAQNMNELIRCIENEEFDLDKLEQFRHKFFGHFDGKSSERVVNELISEPYLDVYLDKHNNKK